MDKEDFPEPTDAMNFLERYREARSGSAPSTPRTGALKGRRPEPQSPNTPSSRSSRTKDVWTSVFHPLGKPSTKADRYDLGKKASPHGESVSEIHAKGIASIRLDNPPEE